VEIYSEEIRRKVLESVLEKNNAKTAVAKALGISRRTIHNWCQVYEKTGRTGPILTRTGPGKRRKLDPEEFRKFIDQNNSMSIEKMCNALGVGKTSVATAIRAIGYTRKKNNIYTKSAAKNNETNSSKS
jgi:transposase